MNNKSLLLLFFSSQLLHTITTTSLTIPKPVDADITPQDKKGPLYYYWKFESDNNGLPSQYRNDLDTHYNKEHNLRSEHYKLKDRETHLQQDVGFKTRKIKHSIISEKNKVNVLKSQLHANNKTFSQKERAMQEQINHDEKFREVFAERLGKNQSDIPHALPDEKIADKKLAKFDKDRIDYFRDNEIEHQKKLSQIQSKDDEMTTEYADRIARREARIVGYQETIKSLHDTEKLEEKMLRKNDNRVNLGIYKANNRDNAMKDQVKMEEAVAKMAIKNEQKDLPGNFPVSDIDKLEKDLGVTGKKIKMSKKDLTKVGNTMEKVKKDYKAVKNTKNKKDAFLKKKNGALDKDIVKLRRDLQTKKEIEMNKADNNEMLFNKILRSNGSGEKVGDNHVVELKNNKQMKGKGGQSKGVLEEKVKKLEEKVKKQKNGKAGGKKIEKKKVKVGKKKVVKQKKVSEKSHKNLKKQKEKVQKKALKKGKKSQKKLKKAVKKTKKTKKKTKKTKKKIPKSKNISKSHKKKNPKTKKKVKKHTKKDKKSKHKKSGHGKSKSNKSESQNQSKLSDTIDVKRLLQNLGGQAKKMVDMEKEFAKNGGDLGLLKNIIGKKSFDSSKRGSQNERVYSTSQITPVQQ